MKRSVLFASIVVASGVLSTNVYNSLIDARAWGSDIPHSIEAARTYFKAIHPGYFFRIATPLVQLLGLLSLVLAWRAWKPLRLHLGGAFLCFALTDVLTFTFFYPRNAFLFEHGSLADVAALTTAWSEWNTINWIRSGLFLAGVTLSCLALHRSYRLQPVRQDAGARAPAASPAPSPSMSPTSPAPADLRACTVGG